MPPLSLASTFLDTAVSVNVCSASGSEGIDPARGVDALPDMLGCEDGSPSSSARSASRERAAGGIVRVEPARLVVLSRDKLLAIAER
jgi:hypothetical protein